MSSKKRDDHPTANSDGPSTPCLVEGCDEVFPQGMRRSLANEDMHFARHFDSLYAPGRSRRQHTVDGIWNCPDSRCSDHFLAEDTDDIRSHKIKHVQNNPELFK